MIQLKKHVFLIQTIFKEFDEAPDTPLGIQIAFFNI